MIKFVLTPILIVILCSFSNALEIAEYNIDFNLVDSKIVVEAGIDVLKEGEFVFDLPEDAKGVSVYLNGNPIEEDVMDNKLSMHLNANDELRFNFVTNEFVKNDNFLVDLNLGEDIKNLNVNLILPEDVSLDSEIADDDMSSASIYPRPDEITSDGRSIIFSWHRENLGSLALFAKLERGTSYYWIFALALATAVALFFFFPRKIQIRMKNFDGHLKEEEEQIVSILKQREGHCEQGTLRVLTGMPKASLSRVLKELEDRKVICKENRGKKNVVFLK